MRKILLIFLLPFTVLSVAQSQSFTVDELIKLAYLPSKNVESYMKKKGFVYSGYKSEMNDETASFIEKGKSKKIGNWSRSIDICIKDNSKKFTLYTTALSEYQQGQQNLIKAGYFYDNTKDLKKESSILFQKANITIKSSRVMQDSVTLYSFDLVEKSIPSSLRYAEDLLQFDSHEFLVSYFGEHNVKKDRYYLSEKELKRCSVLFSGTERQAVFVWDDDIYLNNLAYILLTNKLPTEEGMKNDPLAGNNEWQLENGLRPGMALKELLKINEIDFNIYGNKSELAFLVKPTEDGKINFKKTAVMLSCPRCFDDKIFNQKEVSALDIAKANLPMRVFDVVIYAAK